MSTIKSYAAKEAGADLSLWEYDAGELLPQDVEVQVEYCGICHSDLSMIDNEWGMSSYPLVAGHEVIGRVAALGSAAQDKGRHRLDGAQLRALRCLHQRQPNQLPRRLGANHHQPRRLRRQAARRLAMGDPAAGEYRYRIRRPDAVRRDHRL